MKFVKALLVALVLSHGAHAEGMTPFRTTAMKKLSKRSRSPVTSIANGYTAGAIPTMTFTMRLHTEGHVRVSLHVRKAVNWTSTISKEGRDYVQAPNLELYQGEVLIRGVRYPAAASVVGKNIVLSFPGRQRGSRASRQRVFTLTAPVVTEGAATVRVASAPSAVFHNKTCGDTHDHGEQAIHSMTIEPLNAGLPRKKMYHVLTLSTVGDPALYAKFGENTNAHIAGIVNTAEALFERQLGIRFQIVKQHVYADIGALSIPETDPARLLRVFAASSENAAVMGIKTDSFDEDVDIKHLFTGKDLDQSTVGIAYVGTVCYQPKYAYGLTQDTTGGGSSYYFAHEIGHNLGARHDMVGWKARSLMAPNIIVGSSFSKTSIDQINDHLLNFGSCLELKAMAPSLFDSKLSLTVRKNRRSFAFAGKLVSRRGERIVGAKITLRIGSKKVSLITNAAGRFSHVTSTRRMKKNAVFFARTVGGEAESLKIRASSL